MVGCLYGVTDPLLIDSVALDALGWEVADRALAGQATALDEAALQAWRAVYPDAFAAIVHLQAALGQKAFAPTSADDLRAQAGAIRTAHASKLPIAEDAVRGARVKIRGGGRLVAPNHKATRLWKAMIGGGIAVALVAIAFKWPITVRDSNASAARQRYTTLAGERRTIQLQDGSRITLAPGTTVTVEPEFGTRTRALSLVGEGYFEVPHASGLPFTVRTGGVTTRVLGTSFDVRRYPNESHVQISVVTGKLAALPLSGRARTTVVLGVGTTLRMTDSGATTMNTGDVAQYTGWVDGLLSFRATPVNEMLRVVGRWYDLDFQLSDSSLSRRHVTVVFDRVDREEAVRIIESLLDVVGTRGDSSRIVFLKARRPVPAPAARNTRHLLFPTQEVGK